MTFRDVRYALRSLWIAKGFSTVAILCLGFGIGLNTTIFSIVDGVLLKPFPYAEPDRLIVISSENREAGRTVGQVSFADLEDVKASARTLSMAAGIQYRSVTLSDAGADPARYQGGAVTWDLFPLLGISPVLGRGFTPDDDRPGAEAVVLISHAVFTLRYQSDPGVIGRAVLINAAPAVIVGVMPPNFEFPQNQKIWIPVGPILADAPRAARGLLTFGRLAPGATVDAARSELEAIAQTLAAEFPATNRGWRLYPRDLRDEFIPSDVSQIIWIMMAAVTLVLFIACSNVANLQLARATTRRRELSVRSALGAGRGRILRQLLTESVVLALVSVPLGLVLAAFGTHLIASGMPPDEVPYYITWSMDARTTAYAIVVAIVTAVLFGLLPAFQASRRDLVESLKEGTRGNSVRRSLLRSSLVVTQVSLALVALVGALLFVQTFVNLNSFAVGFDTRPLMTMRVYLSGEAYTPAGAKGRRVKDILERIERLPGVRAAFASNMVPLSGGGGGGRVVVDGRSVEAGQEPFIDFIGVTPGFARTLGLTVRGRDFTDADGWAASGVALVNDTMARQMWPDRDAINGRFRMTEGQAGWFTVIGIVPDIQMSDIDPDDRPFPAAFVPYAAYQETLSTGLTIRTAGSPADVAAPAREAIRAADANLPVSAVATMEEVRRLGFWQFQLFGWIFGSVGLVGLVLAAVGVYGVLSYGVSQRTQEIGVRVALGAGRWQVIRLIVGQGLVLAGVGIVLGVGLSIGAVPVAGAFFYQVSPYDPLTLISVSAFLVFVALLASYVPARRATRVDPLIALRAE